MREVEAKRRGIVYLCRAFYVLDVPSDEAGVLDVVLVVVGLGGHVDVCGRVVGLWIWRTKRKLLSVVLGNGGRVCGFKACCAGILYMKATWDSTTSSGIHL